MHLESINLLKSHPTNWLWPWRLAFGKLALLDGDPGLGKSLITLDLCARLSTGRPFSDGSPGPGVCASILLNAEDSPTDTTRPRLQSLGANLKLIYVPKADEEHATTRWSLPAHAAALDDALEKTQARLVVIDPLMAFLDPTVTVASDAHARRALAPLAELAENRQCVILLVRHLNKHGGRRALYRGGGSIGIVGACRSAWLVAADPADPNRRVLAEIKNNLAPRQPSLAFQVAAVTGAPPEVAWLGTSPLTADQLVAARPVTEQARPHERAEDFLKGFLRDGPRTSRDIWLAAREQGHTVRTLNRAKRVHDIQSQRVYRDGKRLSYWLWPGQKLAEPDPPPTTLEPWLASLRERFPVPTPIDEL